MGQQDVDAARPSGREPELPGAPPHFSLGVLEGIIPVVPIAPAQTHDAQPLPNIDRIVHTDAATRLRFLVTAVVVAVDVQDGGGGEVREVFEIFFRQITAGEDKVDAFQPLADTLVPEQFGRHIRDRKYFHDVFAPFFSILGALPVTAAFPLRCPDH